MKEYVFYVRDDRLERPTARRAHVRTYDAAWKLAERMLRETYHHLSVEVWTDGKQVLIIRTGEDDAAAA